MTKQEAKVAFLRLVELYGLGWGPDVPPEAYKEMTAISEVLTPEEKRIILGWRGETNEHVQVSHDLRPR